MKWCQGYDIVTEINTITNQIGTLQSDDRLKVIRRPVI